MEQEFRLTQLESSSALWTRVSAHLEERLSVMREMNDRTLDAMETARLRGKIEAVKQLLAAGKPATDIKIYD